VIYDPSISLGAILQLVGIVITLLIVYTQVVARLTRVETKVDALWAWFMKTFPHDDA